MRKMAASGCNRWSYAEGVLICWPSTSVLELPEL